LLPSTALINISCCILGSTLPHWVFGLQACGFTISLIYLKSDFWVDLITTLFPHAIVSLGVQPVSVDLFILLAVDRSIPFGWEYWNCSLLWILSTRPCGSKFHCSSWFCVTIAFPHTLVGGVTTGMWHISCLSRHSMSKPAFHAEPGRDMRSILDCRYGNGSTITAPMLLLSVETLSLELWPGSFHGLVLFSHRIQRPYFITPSEFHSTGWTLRRLMAEELLRVYDFSPSLIKLLPKSSVLALCSQPGMPLKIICRACRYWQADFLTATKSLLLGGDLLRQS
jgi:uncharacterized membrane protein YsdA (DUF1294 family)